MEIVMPYAVGDNVGVAVDKPTRNDVLDTGHHVRHYAHHAERGVRIKVYGAVGALIENNCFIFVAALRCLEAIRNWKGCPACQSWRPMLRR